MQTTALRALSPLPSRPLVRSTQPPVPEPPKAPEDKADLGGTPPPPPPKGWGRTLLGWTGKAALGLTVGAVGLGAIGYLVLAVALLAVPVNLLLIGVENWLYLLFPMRLQATPGDFSQAGRQVMLAMAKLLALAVGLGLPALVGAAVFDVTRDTPP